MGDAALRARPDGGTALGGWRIIRTVGRRIYRIQPIDGLSSQTRVGRCDLRGVAGGRAGLDHPGRRVLRRGRGAGRARWRHVHWAIVRHMGLAWLITIPVTAAIAMPCYGLLELLT